MNYSKQMSSNLLYENGHSFIISDSEEENENLKKVNSTNLNTRIIEDTDSER
jgi:hypothetical protein